MATRYIHLLTFKFRFENGQTKNGVLRYPSNELYLTTKEFCEIEKELSEQVEKKYGKIEHPATLVNSMILRNES